MKAYLQRTGRSLQLPVAVLPAVALLIGIGNWWASYSNDIIAYSLQAGGSAVLGQLPLLLAVGSALGMSVDKSGAAALTGLVVFEAPVNVLKTDSVATLLNVKPESVDPSFAQISNVFIGIIAGLIAAALYNRFYGAKLPMALSFFSGKRLVPILAAFVMLLISAVLLLVWPPVYSALVSSAKFILSLGWGDAGLYGFFNRLLIPTGLYRAMNFVFWLDVAGINDIGKFLTSEGARGVTGMYQAGFLPIMMFEPPAGTYAIYRNTRPENRAKTASLMLAAAFASLFTGATEPLGFSFMFVAWPLYVLHAIFTGISLTVGAFFHWTAGFASSAGFVDYFLSLKNPITNQPLMLVVQGLVTAVTYYFGFNFAIKKFHLMTPGREEAGLSDDDTATTDSGNKYAAQASKIYAALGGADNVTSINNCTTRLRLQVRDTGLIGQNKIKATGVLGMKIIDGKNAQVIVGTEVQFVADEMAKLHGGAAVRPAQTDTAVRTETFADETIEQDIYVIVNGKLIPIIEVSDDVFAEKMMGDGYAVLPGNGEIFSPIAGTITNIFPTKHAIGIQTSAGVEVLLHTGISTVDLKDEPFTLYTEEGQKVARGQLIALVDLAAIQSAGKNTDTVVVFTNGDKVQGLETEPTRDVKANDKIGSVSDKA